MFAADLLRRLAGTAQQPVEHGFTDGLLYAQERSRARASRQNAIDWAPVAPRSQLISDSSQPIAAVSSAGRISCPPGNSA